MSRRADLAAAVRPFAPGGKLTAAHIPAFNALADALGLPHDGLPLNVAAFFAALRPALFPALTEAEVAALDVLVQAIDGLPLAHGAYVLATAHHETGAKMVPNVESLNYSVEGLLNNFGRHRISVADARRFGRTKTRAADQVAIGNTLYGGAFGRGELGNTQPGDGYKYRGRGYPHHTGRAGYARVDAELGLGGALLADPDLLLRVDVAVPALVRGMVGGWFTGKALGNLLPTQGAATLAAFKAARPIINGTDRAALVAEYAMNYQAALTAGANNEDRTPIETIEATRNALAFLLVMAFIIMGGALFAFTIPEQNKEIVTYMVGQLSGMALTALGFYFINKVGQDAIDAKRVDNTSKALDAIAAATGADPQSPTGAPGDPVHVIEEPKP